MFKTYVFTSYELYPINAGGCGVFIYNAIRQLLQESDNRVVLLLDMPKHECELFIREFQPKLPGHEHLEVICLSEWIKEEVFGEKYTNVFLHKSFRFYKGLHKLTLLRQIDYIEFFDYVGIGYFSVKAKKYEGQFSETILSVRAHCTIDLMDLEQVPNSFDLNKLEMYQMEKEVIQDADVVLVPSNAWGEIYIERYGAQVDKVIVSPPPVEIWEDVNYNLNANQQNVIFYGRIFQLKGVDLFIDAAIAFMIKRPENNSIFYLVGYDGLDLNGRPYKEQLLKRVPEKLKNRFAFTGQLKHKELEELLRDVRFAVFPNYVESFCYSIHELYNVGVPIIANDIPAFRDYFQHQKNALLYQGTSSDLVVQMECFFDNEKARYSMSKPYRVTDNQDFNGIYKGLLKINPIHNDRTIISNENDKLSIIILDEGRESAQGPLSLMAHPKVDKEKSYILTRNATGTPVHYLGELRYATKVNGDIDDLLPVSKFVLTCYADDTIDIDYIIESLRIFTISSSVRYVGAHFKNAAHYEQYNLLEPHTYRNYTKLTRAIIKLDEYSQSLRDVYDIRLSHLGEKKILQMKGYIIPKELLTVVEQGQFDIKEEHYIFSTHNSTRNNEWNPYVLYPYLIATGSSTNLAEKTKNPILLKKAYFKIKHKVDTVSGRKGKVLVGILEKMHKEFKKRF